MRNKISSFLLNSAKSKGLSDVYVAQIDAIKESLAGKIFVLAEFSSGKKAEWKKIFDFIVSSLEENYYNDEKLFLKDKIEGLKVENIFEAALARTNLDLNDFLEEEKIKISPTAVNLSVGVIFENKLHFSNFGKNRALLIYKQKSGYEMINVETNAFEKNEEEFLSEDGRSVPKTPKIFSSIISGEIPKNAFFVFTSESIPEYLSEKELVTIISKLPPLTAASQLKNVLEQINSFVPFFGLIIKSASEIDPNELTEDFEEMPHMHRLSSSLSHTEKRTEEMLSTGGLLNWNRIKSGLKEIISEKTDDNKSLKLVKQRSYEDEVEEEVLAEEAEEEILSEETEEEFLPEEVEEEILAEELEDEINEDDVSEELVEEIIEEEEIEAIIETVAEESREEISKPEIQSIRTVSVEKRFFRPDSSAISINRTSRLNFKNSISKPFSFFGLFFKNAFSGGSGRKRMTFSLLAGLFVILAASIWLTAVNNKNKAIQEEFARLASEIESKEAAINMRLLYDDTEGAKSILDEARESLSKLPQKNNEQIAAYTELLSRLDSEQEKVYRIKRLQESEEVFDLSGKNPFGLKFAGDKIFAFSGDKAYSLNTKDKKSAEYSLSNNYSGYSSQFDDKNTIYLLKGNKLAKFDTNSGKETIVEVKGLDENISYQAFNIYATNRLYLLNKDKNEIVARSGASYANTSSWLKESADLSKAQSIFVNGSIFILNTDGKVDKYFTGKKESYDSSALEPQLGDFQRMTGSANRLYILDPGGKRLAVLDINKGTLIAQYIFEAAQEVKDFSVDEKNNQIYILDGEKVYRYKM